MLEKTIREDIVGILPQGQFSQNVLLVLSQIFLKDQFLKRKIVNGLIYYPQQRNNIKIEYNSSIKLTPIRASLKKNQGFVYKNFLYKRRKIKPKYQIKDLVRVSDLQKTFSEGDTTNWSYKLYKVTENVNETIPSYHSGNLSERYNEALLKKTNFTLNENKDVLEKLYITQSKST